jgi:RAB protein geranylgeranyltransferase component A
LKKSLAKLCPIVEAFLRHDQIFKEKGDVTNEKHVKTHEENVAKEVIYCFIQENQLGKSPIIT